MQTNVVGTHTPLECALKLIPLMIVNAIFGEKLPIYGDDGNIRDWLFMEDHCAGIALVLKRGHLGETDKLTRELGFPAETRLADGLRRTVEWYFDNERWWRAIQGGAYRDWMKLQYGAALTGSAA